MSAYSVAAVAFAVAVIFFVIGFFVGEAEIKDRVKKVLHRFERYEGDRVSVKLIRWLLRQILE